MLPARTCFVENEALTQLKAAMEIEAYRHIHRRGHHSLPYKEDRRGDYDRLIREVVRRVQAHVSVTDAQRAALGITVRDAEPLRLEIGNCWAVQGQWVSSGR